MMFVIKKKRKNSIQKVCTIHRRKQNLGPFKENKTLVEL